jgi:hypothetical protein
MDVLFAQRDLVDARAVLIDTKREQLAATVNAYQALGGGAVLLPLVNWDGTAMPPDAAQAQIVLPTVEELPPTTDKPLAPAQVLPAPANP